MSVAQTLPKVIGLACFFKQFLFFGIFPLINDSVLSTYPIIYCKNAWVNYSLNFCLNQFLKPSKVSFLIISNFSSEFLFLSRYQRPPWQRTTFIFLSIWSELLCSQHTSHSKFTFSRSSAALLSIYEISELVIFFRLQRTLQKQFANVANYD